MIINRGEVNKYPKHEIRYCGVKEMMNILSVFSRSAPSLPFSLGPKSINMTHPPFQALSQRLIIQIIQQNTVKAASFFLKHHKNHPISLFSILCPFWILCHHPLVSSLEKDTKFTKFSIFKLYKL